MITKQFTFFCSVGSLLLLNVVTNSAVIILSFVIVGLIWEVSGPEYALYSGTLWGLNLVIRNFAYPFELNLLIIATFTAESYLSKRFFHHILQKRL